MTQEMSGVFGPVWTRASDGMVAGVCKGIATRLDVEVWLVRLLWLVSVFFFGSGILAYFVLAFCFPTADKVAAAQFKKLAGVCLWLSRKTGVDLGLVRAGTIFLALGSLGATLMIYIILGIALKSEIAELNRPA